MWTRLVLRPLILWQFKRPFDSSRITRLSFRLWRARYWERVTPTSLCRKRNQSSRLHSHILPEWRMRREARERSAGAFLQSLLGQRLSRCAEEKLDLLEEFLRSKHEDIRTKSMVDTGELSDRAVAERAGIGFSAKNCMITTPEYGSYVYLAEMITNIPFEPDVPIEDMCGSCTKCLDACPTGALVNPGQLNARYDLFLTQTKGFCLMNSGQRSETACTDAIRAKRCVLLIKGRIFIFIRKWSLTLR